MDNAKALFLAMAITGLAGCEDKPGEPIWRLKSVSTGIVTSVGWMKTREVCREAIEEAAVIRFADLKSFTASDEEEHGLGLVLVCVPGIKTIYDE